MERKTLGRYQILERIGRGSMGLVYKGKDPKLDRTVALKVIIPPTDDPDSEETRTAVERFYIEARAAARVSHPSIVTVYDVGEDETEAGPVVYIAMEYLEGGSLDQWRGRESPSPVESVRVVRRLAEGLATAHNKGVVHRDVKPSNIIMTGEGAKLTDFGLAYLPHIDDSTLSGKIVGTPAYMSPEQASGGESTRSSDIFSLTVVLYQLLTDRLPFVGENPMGILYSIINTSPPHPSIVNDRLTPSVDAVVMKGLAKKPEDRYASAEEMIDAIDLLLVEMEGEEKGTANDAHPFPTITLSIDDDPLSRRLGPFFKKRRIPFHKSPPLPERELARHLLVNLRKEHLALVNFQPKSYYQPEPSTFTVADLIRLIRQFDQSAPTQRFIPLFLSDAPSKKQHEVMRLLGAYGVTYVLFLSPGDPPHEQEKQVADALADFVDLLHNDFETEEEAPDLFDDARIVDTRRYQELLAIGSDLMERGRLEEAIEAFTQALALNPDFEILIHRGDAFYRSRNYVAALGDYRKAQRLKNSTPEADAKIGACCLVLAKELKEKDPDKSTEWFEKGVERLEQSRETARRLEEAFADEPERLGGSPYTPILGALRSVDITIDDFADATQRLATVIETAVAKSGEIDDDSLDTMLSRGVGLSSLKRFDEAETVFRAAFEADPKQAAPAYNNFAVALRKQGRLQQAFENFATLIETDTPDRKRIAKNMRTATMHYAHDLIKKGRPNEAEALYARAVSLKMDDPEWAALDLAMAHLHAKGTSEARACLKKAIAQNPSLVSSPRFDQYKSLTTLLYPDESSLR